MLGSKIINHHNLITLLSKIFNNTTNEWEKHKKSFELLIPKWCRCISTSALTLPVSLLQVTQYKTKFFSEDGGSLGYDAK